MATTSSIYQDDRELLHIAHQGSQVTLCGRSMQSNGMKIQCEFTGRLPSGVYCTSCHIKWGKLALEAKEGA